MASAAGRVKIGCHGLAAVFFQGAVVTNKFPLFINNLKIPQSVSWRGGGGCSLRYLRRTKT